MKRLNIRVLTIALLFCIALKAQHTSRFAFNSSVGTNQLWTSVAPGSGTLWNNSISFVPHHLFTIELENERGTLNGRNNVVQTDGSSSEHAFRTNCNYWGGNLCINLFDLFNDSRKPTWVIPYLYAGVGYLDFDAERLDPANNVLKHFTYNVYTTKVGMRFRFKINNQLDWLATIETTTPQSFYVDANPIPKGYDTFSSFKLGLSYKIGARAKSQYIDWKYHPRKQACINRFY